VDVLTIPFKASPFIVGIRLTLPNRAPKDEAAHARTTTWVVVPPMLVEALTAVLPAWRPPSTDLAGVCWAGLAIVVVIWASTAALQVPRHNKLAKGFDAEAHGGLVCGDWIRTVSWSLRGVLVLLILNQASG
jgi:hypothetical protein